MFPFLEGFYGKYFPCKLATWLIKAYVKKEIWMCYIWRQFCKQFTFQTNWYIFKICIIASTTLLTDSMFEFVFIQKNLILSWLLCLNVEQFIDRISKENEVLKQIYVNEIHVKIVFALVVWSSGVGWGWRVSNVIILELNAHLVQMTVKVVCRQISRKVLQYLKGFRVFKKSIQLQEIS